MSCRKRDSDARVCVRRRRTANHPSHSQVQAPDHSPQPRLPACPTWPPFATRLRLLLRADRGRASARESCPLATRESTGRRCCAEFIWTTSSRVPAAAAATSSPKSNRRRIRRTSEHVLPKARFRRSRVRQKASSERLISSRLEPSMSLRVSVSPGSTFFAQKRHEATLPS